LARGDDSVWRDNIQTAQVLLVVDQFEVFTLVR
jgi:hypothetical protein